MALYPDIRQDFWLTLTQTTLTPNFLACHAQRNRLHTFTKEHRDCFQGKMELHYTSAPRCFERTQQTLVLTKAISWDKIKTSLNKQQPVNIQQRERSGPVSPKHTQDCLASYKFMRLIITVTIWNTRTLKVTKTLVTAGISHHCFLKGEILSFRKKQQNENEKAVTSTEKEQWALFEEQEIRLKANSITKGRSKQEKKKEYFF